MSIEDDLRARAGERDEREWPAHVARTVRFFESITPQSAASIEEVYAPDARFRDPFNELRGLEAIRRVYLHMFEQVEAPAFRVLEVVVQDQRAFLAWDFTFRFRRGDRALQRIHGGSWLRYDADGRICDHRDYWDAAQELYEKLPLLGALMRWLRRRVAGT